MDATQETESFEEIMRNILERAKRHHEVTGKWGVKIPLLPNRFKVVRDGLQGATRFPSEFGTITVEEVK